MSYNQQKVVLEQSETKGPQRLLLMVLAFHANKDTGLCCPNHETLVDETGMSLPTVKRVVGQLKDSGEVLVSDGRGRGNKNHYIITLGRGANEIKREVDDYEKNGIRFDTITWEQKVSEVTPYNEEKGPIPEEKGIESDTSNDIKGINFEEKGIESDTSMLTESNLNLNTTTPDQNFDNGSDLGFQPPDPVFAELCQYYAKHCSPSQTITKHVADKIQAELDDQTPKEWLNYALEVAADNEAYRWSFIQAVLDQIKDAGSLNEHVERRKTNGHKSGSGKSKATGKAGGSTTQRQLNPDAEENRRRNEANNRAFDPYTGKTVTLS